jgi:hypothetical protein
LVSDVRVTTAAAGITEDMRRFTPRPFTRLRCMPHRFTPRQLTRLQFTLPQLTRHQFTPDRFTQQPCTRGRRPMSPLARRPLRLIPLRHTPRQHALPHRRLLLPRMLLPKPRRRGRRNPSAKRVRLTTGRLQLARLPTTPAPGRGRRGLSKALPRAAHFAT